MKRRASAWEDIAVGQMEKQKQEQAASQSPKYVVTLSAEQRAWLQGVAVILNLHEEETLQILIESYVDTAIARKAQLAFERELRDRAAREGARVTEEALQEMQEMQEIREAENHAQPQ